LTRNKFATVWVALTMNMDTENMGYEDEYAENYQLQDQVPYDGDGSGYVQNQVIVGSNPNSSSLFRSEEMALCQLFLQVNLSKLRSKNT